MHNKEIRDILLGRMVPLDRERWGAAPAGTRFRFYGFKDGAGDVRLFGVTRRGYCYRSERMEPDAAFDASAAALASMGRPIRLSSMPERTAHLYAPSWIAPVLLTLGRDGDILLLTAYTGNSILFGQLRCRIALWILGRRLPEGMVCTGKNRRPDGDGKARKKQRDASERKPLLQRNKKQSRRTKK